MLLRPGPAHLNELLLPLKNSKSILPALSLLWLILLGCQHTYQEKRLEKDAALPRLSTDATAYVAIPPDAWDKKQVATDSGKLTAVAVRDAFAKNLKRAFLARRLETFSQSLETARNANCTYLVYPTVLLWEDHSTEFSGVRDKIEVRIRVADSVSGDILAETILKGKSRWFTDGGDVPQDLLQEPIQNYVASLFHPVYVPSALR
jgi:hypothetical protein